MNRKGTVSTVPTTTDPTTYTLLPQAKVKAQP
jgi:hypothetical protein